MNRCGELTSLALAVAACARPCSAAMAQAYPDKPTRLYVGYPAGGGTDFIARMVAFNLSERLGQQLVVMNLPGATGAIALDIRPKHATF